MLPNAEFPAPIRMGGRLRFDHHDAENYKRALAGLALIDRNPSDPIRFISASDLCADLGIDRRTLGRRVYGRVKGEAGQNGR